MKILSRLSAGELEALRKSERVALVLMGCGAKGAYQLGVWRAIWNLGVRKLATITGTSAGALNAFLFANGDQFCLDEGQAATWKRWRSAQGAGLRSMYVNAGFMLEIADFVDQNCTGVDQELLAALRDDAMQIRTCALIELTKYACSQVSERTIVNAARAATYYADKLSRTAQLLEGNRPELVLDFANSMQ